MDKYPKIQSIYKREKKGRFITGEFSRPEFQYLQNNIWTYTEKVNGTNIRIQYRHDYPDDDYRQFRILGRSSSAQLQPFLIDKLNSIFSLKKFKKLYPKSSMCLYGEGYGAKIQKGGGNYISDGVDFILFDIKIDQYWLKRSDIEDIASKLNIKVVPIVGKGTIHEAIEVARGGFFSWIGANCRAEGLVLKPEVDLMMQNGERVITKVKYRDFKWEREESKE